MEYKQSIKRCQQIWNRRTIKITSSKGRLVKLTDMVEKPAVEKAPSQLAVLGRYVLTPEIFELLETQGKEQEEKSINRCH